MKAADVIDFPDPDGEVEHDFYGDTEPDDEEDFDCGMDIRGACGKAGSEECEFECPFGRRGLRTN